MTADPRERLLDLLVAEATQGLSEAEANELRGLLMAFPDEDPDALARAAAAADLALSAADGAEPLPDHLAAQLEHQAMAYLGHQPAPEPAYTRPAPRPRPTRAAYLGWAIAAGLAAVLLWTLWKPPVRVPTPDEQFAKLQKLPDSKEFRDEKAGATGEIVWNTSKQEGYIKVKGLPALDP